MAPQKQLVRLLVFGLSFWMLTACHLVARSPAPQPTISLPTPNLSTPLLAPPTASPLAVLTNDLENVRVVGLDTFDDPSAWIPNNEIANGELRLAGLGDNNWHGLSNRAIFREGSGVVIDFQFTPTEFFEMYFEREAWTTSRYKRFGVYVNGDHSMINIFSGRQRREPTPLAGNLALAPATWYSLLLAVGNGGDFLAVIWDPANPGASLQSREIIPGWQGLDWSFRMQVNQGTIRFDNFEELTFDRLK
jgi:hypothetical protein